MATITKENIGLLHEKLTVNLEKTDYLPSFEKALKEYSKKANIPGFRKGMVPAGLVKKMYGSSIFTDEVLRTVDKELVNYLQTDKTDIFAQPLPLETNLSELDVNNPKEYSFDFEVGLKPEFMLPDLGKAATTKYVVTITDEMLNSEIERLQNRYGNMLDKEIVETDDNVLNVVFREADATGIALENGKTKDNSLLVKYFAATYRSNLLGKKVGDVVTAELNKAFEEKELDFISKDLGFETSANATGLLFNIEIVKIGLLEKRELNEDFFNQLYPGQEIKTDADFRKKLTDEIQQHWNNQAKNQIHDQVFHELVDHTSISFPESFLKKWMKTQGETPKTDAEVEAEFPTFLKQLKWSLVSDKIVNENKIEVSRDEVKDFAKQQLFSYMGGANLGDDQPWVNDYIEKMMKDKKYIEDAYTRLQSQKMFEWAETQVNPTDKPISAEEFTKLMDEHREHHH